MRKIILLLAGFIISCHTLIYSQNIVRSSTDVSGNTTFTIDISHTNLGPFVQPNTLHQRGVKKTLPFLEFGDGGFTTQAVTTHKLCSRNYSALLFAASTYDTTRPYTRIALSPNTTLTDPNTAYSNSVHYSSNDQAVLPINKNIFITSNVNEIVPGDFNNFAITYKIPVDTSAILPEYRIVFFYNTNSIFNPIDGSNRIENDPSMIRLFYGDQVTNDATNNNMRSSAQPDPNLNFAGSITILCGTATADERNVFITTNTDASVKLNDETSICAVLLKSTNGWSTWQKIDDYYINNMPVAQAHDPNYIIQTGQCILLPKRSKKISYRVHFQNDGLGQAGRVDVHIKLPKGINNNNINFEKANCGGSPFTFSAANTQYDKEHYSLSFTFKKDDGTAILQGTQSNTNPFNNPNTMGDIFFSVDESVITTDTLPATAEIYFYNVGSDTPLAPVNTNLAVSIYKDKCDGGIMDIKVDTAKYWGPPIVCTTCPTCITFIKICWYWWLLLIPVFLVVYWGFRRYKTKKRP